MRRATASSNNKDWAVHCAEAAVGGLSALAAVPCGKLVQDPALRRLLKAVAAEATAAARKDGLRVAGRPENLAVRICRRSPSRIHPWARALRTGHATGSAGVFEPLLKAARQAGEPTPKLGVIAKVLQRLDKLQ